MKYYLSFILLLIKINSIEISLEKENLKDSMKIYDKLNFFEIKYIKNNFLLS